MRSSARPGRVARVGLLIAVLVGGLVAAPGTAGAAQNPNRTTLRPTQWLSTDSRTPFHTITEGDARVGSWRGEDGKHHIGKTYFTYDLTQLKGTTVFTARFSAYETAVGDCDKPRTLELWTATPHGPISWAFQPRELVKAPDQDGSTPCADPWVVRDLGEIVRNAVAEGRSSLTLVARITRDHQGDVAHGRSLGTAPGLDITFNTPPRTPTELTLDNRPCDVETVTAARRPFAEAQVSDPDPGGIEGRLAFWPVDAPDQRVEHTVSGSSSSMGAHFPADMVQDGREFAFAARAEDGHADSEWSAPCVFTADFTAPAAAPTVTSAVYRENAGPPGDGGEGVPGEFTFDAGGDEDVVAFEYSGLAVGSGRVSADRPGGSARITTTPTTDGPVSITVSGVDRAGNRSPARSYRYWIRTTAPAVQRMPVFELGVPADVVLAAKQDGATAFAYRLDDGPEQTVPVGADRTGRVTLTFLAGRQDHSFDVWTVDAGGFRSGITDRHIRVEQYVPMVTVDPYDPVVGDRVVITATQQWPEQPDVVAYVFQVRDGAEVAVPVDASGGATYEHTIVAPGHHLVRAAGVNAAGIRSGWGVEWFDAVAPAPTATSAVYPVGQEAGGPGVEGAFTFSSSRLPVASFRYRFQGGEEHTVAAGPDGAATVRWTPKAPGKFGLHVVGVSASGFDTEPGHGSFAVKALPRFTHVPQHQGDLVVRVSSRTPDGTVSGRISQGFSVSP